MSETNVKTVKTVKKIKKVVVTEDTRYQTFGIDTEFKSDKQFPKSENKEYSKIVNSECVDSKSNDVVVKKVKKVVKSVEPTYYVHTCGYDYVVDTIDADVAFSGSESECGDWIKERSIVEGFCSDDSSVSDFGDFESSKVEVNNTADLPTVKKVKKCVASDETSVCEPIDYGKQIVFTKVTDLDPKLYEDFFTKEKFEYGAIFFDWEVLKYDWCVTFYDVMNYKKTVIVNDRKGLIKFYTNYCRNNLLFGFNCRSYDNTIFKAILLGMNPKEVSDKIVQGLKPFQISDRFKEIELNSFDCYKIGLGSLKKCESFLQLSVEETPISFDIDRMLTKEEMDSILFYNDADVQSTIAVCVNGQYKVYEGNIGIIKMFNFPISDINKTQAQLTAKITDCEKPKESRNDEWDLWVFDSVDLHKYKYVQDWFMSLKNDHDRPRIETYENGKFVPYKGKGTTKKEGFELHTKVCGIEHVFAMGGLHSAPDDPIHVVKKNGIVHSDISSMYPSLIIQYGLMSRNAKKPKEFENIYEQRLAYKKEKNPLASILKIPLNAQYGILGDINSPAYDIRNAHMICITGQLLILTLLERLEPYISLWNGNTDGIIYTIDDDKNTDLVFKIINDWTKTAKLNFEHDFIDEIYAKDVNNYLFKFSNGNIECKGAMLKYNSPLDNDLPILNETMREYLLNRVNIEDYINNCDELWKFMKTFKMNGDYKFATHNGIKFDNKCFRVFASKDVKSTALLKWKHPIGTILETIDSKGKLVKRKYEGEKFAGQSDHVFIENKDIHGKKCSEYPMLDKQWYIEQVYDRLELFNIDARPSMFDSMF